MLGHVLGSSAKAGLHVPLGFLGPTFDRGNSEALLPSHFNGRDLTLDDIDHHRRVELCAPALEECLIAHDALVSTALNPVQLSRRSLQVLGYGKSFSATE